MTLKSIFTCTGPILWVPRQFIEQLNEVTRVALRTRIASVGVDGEGVHAGGRAVTRDGTPDDAVNDTKIAMDVDHREGDAEAENASMICLIV